MRLTSASPAATERLGRLLGTLLGPGDFLALRGELGGGKTCLTRGIVAALAPECAHLVASPTFAIMNHYPGATPVYHFDFYRLGDEDEIAELGFEDYFHGDGVAIVEWSERLAALLPPDHLAIAFSHEDDERRRIDIAAGGPRSRRLLERLGELVSAENFL